MELILGDCVDKLREIKDSSIDMILTSPPYDSLRNYECLPFDKFTIVASECFRVLKDGAVMVWVVNDSTSEGSESLTSFRQAIHFKDVVGFKLHDTMIYAAEKLVLNQRRYEQKFEFMFVLVKGKLKVFNPIMEVCKYSGVDKKSDSRSYRESDGRLQKWHTDGIVKNEKIRGNIWEYSVGNGKSASNPIAYYHPAIFPEKLAEDHIKSWTNPCEIVLDPFMGAGTTGVACQRLDREFIGIEISPKYMTIAKTRIEGTDRQIAMSL